MDSNGEKIEQGLLHDAVKRLRDYCQTHTDCTDDCYFHGDTGCRLRLYPYEWLEDEND